MTKSILKLTGILLVALALKYHYSTASVNQLRWILAPTTAVVEFLTGIEFNFESHAGYMSSDNTFLIAGSCAGVNFLIIAFLLLTLGPLLREKTLKGRTLLMSLPICYVLTIV